MMYEFFNWLKDEITDIVGTATSMLIAICRLVILEFAFFFSGLNVILFSRTEVCNMEMKGRPFRCDCKDVADKLAYVDKLCLENPDLFDVTEDAWEEGNNEDGGAKDEDI